MNALETKVLELIGENVDSPDVFTDDDTGMAQIRQSISDAIQEIVMLTGGYKRQYFLPLRADMMFYRFALQNGDLGWITDVWSVNNQSRLEQVDLNRISAHDPRWMKSSGTTPRAYMPIGKDIIGLWPKPSASSDVMEITIVEIPAKYESDKDRIKLRDSFQYATVNYAVAEFWASRGDAAESTMAYQRYLDSLGIPQDYRIQSPPSRLQTSKEPWPT